MSAEEYFTFTTEESEKLEVQRLAEELDGNLELAIRRMAERNERNKDKYQSQKENNEKQIPCETGGVPDRYGRHGIARLWRAAPTVTKLCGSWSSVEGKPDVLVYKEGKPR